MIHHRLVARYGFEHVAVGERQHRLASRFARVGARVEVDAHLLPRARRRVEEREVLHILRVLLAVRLTNADAESAGRVFAVPHVPEVRVHFAREEERVRRRECGE